MQQKMSLEAKWVDWRKAKTIDGLDRECHSVVLVAVAVAVALKSVCLNSVFGRHMDIQWLPKDHQRSQRGGRIHHHHSELSRCVSGYWIDRWVNNPKLTNNVLDDNFDGAQRHISTGNFVCRPCAPLVWRYRL